MSLDANNWIWIIKKAAIDVVESRNPFAMRFGEVIQVDPLKICVDQKMTLTKAQLILTDAVQDYTAYMSMDHITENKSGGSGDNAFASHNHEYKGKKLFTVHRALKVGERVVLLRCDGGQKYIVLNRANNT